MRELTETLALVEKMRGQRWHLDGTYADEWPNGDLMEAGADGLETAARRLDAIERLAAERDAFLIETGGCGDGGCIVVKPKGIHTNGGCRCCENRRKMLRLAYAHNRFAEGVHALLAEARYGN